MLDHRHLALGVLLAGLAWAGGGPAASPFATAQRLELPHEVAVDLDGAGGARVSWRGDEIARIELLLLGGRADDPARWRSHALGVAGGSVLSPAHLIQTPLSEGQAGGGPGLDDDLDGRVDEDPFDGLDNDEDGRRDEDFAAVGHLMRVSLADLEGSELPGARLRARWSHWPYFHVDDVLFWDARLETSQSALAGAPAARVDTPHDLVIADEVIEPHVTLGRAEPRRVRFPYLRVEGVDGRRLYLAIVRLDDRTADVLPEGDGIVWEAGSEVGWPLALVIAPTRATLDFSVGQALLTYRAAATGPPNWTVPPLCARCQQTEPLEISLQLLQADADLLVVVQTHGHDEHRHPSAESVSVAGIPLAAHLTEADPDVAEYRMPLESLDAQTILAAALARHVSLTLVLGNGLEVTPANVEVEVDRALWPRVGEPEASAEFPHHLTPHLLQTWPNPFQESTTIRFEVPATLGDAFDFEPDDERVQQLDLEAAPPFGENPVVRVRVYNVGGQLIRVLDEGIRRVGRHSVSWDGADDQGMSVAAGAYYVNVEMGDYRVTRRVLRLKP